MQRRSQQKRSSRPNLSSHKPAVPGEAPHGFLAAFQQLLGDSELPCVGKRRGRKPRVPLTQILPALIFHFMNGAGTLAQHFFQLFNEPLADSSWSDQRARLPFEVFAELMARMLRPRANRRAHPEAFWRGWRLLALDGTQFSLTNMPQIHGALKKAKRRRGRAAFAKSCSVHRRFPNSSATTRCAFCSSVSRFASLP